MGQKVLSVEDIARQVDEPLHRVAYVIRNRQIAPVLLCSGRGFYGGSAMQLVKTELQELDVTEIDEQRSNI